MEGLEDIVVVEDDHEDLPSFARLLYMDLDFAMLKLYILLFTAFDELLSNNSLLSLFLVYCMSAFTDGSGSGSVVATSARRPTLTTDSSNEELPSNS